MRIALVPCVATATLAVGSGAFAGDLNPPAGPVAPTMKTIQEAEPRQFIEQADIPLTINQSGSYYLKENLMPVGILANNIITVIVSNVTIDLRGFTIVGGTEVSQALDGIEIDSRVNNVSISNGNIVLCGVDGISGLSAESCSVRNVNVISCFGDGIVLGQSAEVIDCVANSSGGYGIRVSARSRVHRCEASFSGNVGIFTGATSVITECIANFSLGLGFSGIASNSWSVIENCTARGNAGIGIHGSGGATIRGCSAFDNGLYGFDTGSGSVIVACTAQANAADGFNVGQASQIVDCVADLNGDNGIFLGKKSEVRNCIVRANGLSTNNSGINISVGQCRVDGNHFIGNHFGVTGSPDGTTIVVRNTFTDQVSSIITVSTADHNLIGQLYDFTGGGIIGNDHDDLSDPPGPWSNFLIDTFP